MYSPAVNSTPTLPGVEIEAYPWRSQETIKLRDGNRWRLRSILVQDPHALARMFEQTRDADWLVYDSETSGLNPHLGARICGHALAIQTGEYEVTAWYVPVRHRATTEAQLTPEDVNATVAGIVAYRVGKILGHNLKFDVNMLRADGIRVLRTWHDTSIAATTHNENERSFALKKLGDRYCYSGAAAESEQMDDWMRRDAKTLRLNFKKRGKSTPQELSYLERFGYSRSPIRMCGQYACKDVFLTFLLWMRLKHTTVQFSQVYTRDMEVSKHLHEMEWEGLPVNVQTIRDAQSDIRKEGEYWQDRVRVLTGDPYFDVTDANLRRLFFDTHKMIPPKFTESGLASVDREARMLLVKQYPPHAPLLLAVDAQSKSRKIESTYASSFLRYVTDEMKIHPSYNQLEQRDEGGVPVTGRLSSANPNIQNIAKKPYHLMTCGCKKCVEIGHAPGSLATVSVRRYFTVPKGWLRIFIDLSQIELRVLAWLSRDPVLLDCYANGLDVHQITADEVTGGDRDIAKQVNFGNSYGMTAVGLAKRLTYYADDPHRALKDAEKYLTKFFETYAGILRFRTWLADKMRANGNMFISPFGRPRRIPTIASSDEKERARAARMMMSSIVSGTAADMMKEIMLRCGIIIEREGWSTKLVESVHDELIFDTPIEGCGDVIPKLHAEFERWPMFERGGVPILASVDVSTTTWEDKRAIEVVEGGFRWA